jgi:hypothetical protein|nr:MAG TPA: hypothetical protein [Caudoviricetes sp.]
MMTDLKETRNAAVYESLLLTAAYMRAEDVEKARQAFEAWTEIVRGVDDEAV